MVFKYVYVGMNNLNILYNFALNSKNFKIKLYNKKQKEGQIHWNKNANEFCKCYEAIVEKKIVILCLTSSTAKMCETNF